MGEGRPICFFAGEVPTSPLGTILVIVGFTINALRYFGEDISLDLDF